MSEAEIPVDAGAGDAPPASWSGHAIAAFVVCLPTLIVLPAAIVALVFSVRTRAQWADGEIEAARASSIRARTWAWSALALGGALLFLVVLLGLVYGSNDQNAY